MSESPVKQEVVRTDTGRFPKGVSGNPHGRPPRQYSITDLLRGEVESNPERVLRLLKLCASKDERVALDAIKYLINRLDGMPETQGGTQNIAFAQIVNVIRGGDTLGMTPNDG